MFNGGQEMHKLIVKNKDGSDFVLLGGNDPRLLPLTKLLVPLTMSLVESRVRSNPNGKKEKLWIMLNTLLKLYTQDFYRDGDSSDPIILDIGDLEKTISEMEDVKEIFGDMLTNH
jgi:hypothetical protein